MLRAYAEGGPVYLSATDLEGSFHAVLPDSQAASPGSVLLPGKALGAALAQIVKSADSVATSLTLEIQGDPDGGKVALHVKEGLSVTLRTLPVEDFPTLPDRDCMRPVLTFDKPQELRALIGRILTAVSREESRFQLYGFLVEPQDGAVCNFVSTDGYRLVAEYLDPLTTHQDPDTPGDVFGGFLVPRNPIANAVTGKSYAWDVDRIEIWKSEHHLCFDAGSWGVIARVLEGTFPDWRRVIRKDEGALRMKLDGDALSKSLTAGRPFCGNKSHAVRATLNDRIHIHTEDPDKGAAEMSCDVLSSTWQGEDLVLGFNPSYMLDALKCAKEASDETVLQVWNENSQTVITSGPFTAVVMPIRL